MNELLKRRSLALVLGAALLAVPASIATAGGDGDSASHETGDHGTTTGSDLGDGGPPPGDVGESHAEGVGGDGNDTGAAPGTLPSEGGEDGGSCAPGANSDCVVTQTETTPQ